MKSPNRKRPSLADSEVDEIEIAPLRDVFARPVRRPVEPGVLRSLVIAAIIGVGMGLFVYFFKPTPKAAEAAPVFGPKMMNVQPAPTPAPASQTDSAPRKTNLFALPEWDQAAYERDKLKTK